MRHRKGNMKLCTTAGHRKALLMGLANSLLEHEKVKTTVPKAKALRPFVERLVTLAKTDTMAHRRQAFRYLQRKRIVKRLFETLGPRYATRPGGYLRILRLGSRIGDAADMAQIEFVA